MSLRALYGDARAGDSSQRLRHPQVLPLIGQCFTMRSLNVTGRETIFRAAEHGRRQKISQGGKLVTTVTKGGKALIFEDTHAQNKKISQARKGQLSPLPPSADAHAAEILWLDGVVVEH